MHRWTRPWRRSVPPDHTASGAPHVHLHDRFGLLLLLLLASFVMAGVGDDPMHVLVAFINGLILVIALSSTGAVRSSAGIVGVVVIAVVALVPVIGFDAREPGGGAAWLVQAALMSAVMVVVIRRVMQHERVGMETILGAVCVYVLIGMVFGTIYGAMEAFTDQAILVANDAGDVDPIYYSFVTMTTVGFGDITSPVELVRRITVVEAVFGQVFLATMIARLVSMFGAVRHREPPADAVAN